MVRTVIRLVVVAVFMLLVVRVATERSTAQAPQGGVTALTGVRIIDGTGRADRAGHDRHWQRPHHRCGPRRLRSRSPRGHPGGPGGEDRHARQ